MKKKVLLCTFLMSVAITAMAITTPPQKSMRAPNLLIGPDTVRVSTVDALKSAISSATSDRVIVMNKCTDVDGYYKLGTTGLTYPAKFINLTIMGNPLDTVKVYGTFMSVGPTARVKINSFTFKGLYFERILTGDAEGMNPFYISANDSIMTGLFVNDCVFKDLGTASSARILRVHAAGLVVKKFIFEGNYVKNFGGTTPDGTNGQNMFQFGNFVYECDSIVIKNNLISDYHGGQFINNNRQSMTTSKDSAIYIVVENNTFVRFGGNGSSDRNFIEWTNKMQGCDGYITIRNNIFYKNWSTVNKKCWRLHLFSPDTAILKQKLVVNVQNNLFEPSDVVLGLPITNSAFATSSIYSNFTKESFGIPNVFVDEARLIMTTKSLLYTASTTGGPVGLPDLYTSSEPDRTVAQTVGVNSLSALKYAIKNALDGDTIELQNCQDAAGYYVLGKTGMEYPQKFIDLTIRSASGNNPVLYGSFASTSAANRMKFKNYTFDGLTFEAALGTDLDEMFNPFYISANDSIMTALTVRNCNFINLGQKTRILRANACSGSVVKYFLFERNYIENFGGNLGEGVHGQTFMQWNAVNPGYEFDNVVIRENVINQWHGNQFFNWGRQRLTNKDSLINITIENNTFYKFGGNGTSARNFVEWTNNMGGVAVNLNINKNIFYKNWESNHYKIFRLHLFTPKDSLQATKVKINVVDNYFENDSVAYMAPYTQNLPITNGTLTYTSYKALNKHSLGTNQSIFLKESDGIMSTAHSIFTASSTGSYIGSLGLYSSDSVIVRNAAEIIQVNRLYGLKYAIKNAYNGDIVGLENCMDEVGYFNLGSTGIDYAANFVDLTITPASGNSPVVFGSFKSKTAKMKLNTFTLDGLTFDATNKVDAEGCAPIYMAASDSIMTALNIKNCSFINLGKSGGGRIVDASADKSIVKSFIFEKNIVENFGYTTASNAHGQTFMQWRNSGSYEFDNIILRENIIHKWHGNQFLNVSRQKTSNPDSTFNLTVENNTFYMFGGNGTSARNFIETSASGITGTKKVNITVNNNLFYKTYADNHRSGRIALYTGADPAIIARYNVNVQNNFFFNDSVVCPSPIATYSGKNLPIVGTPAYTNYKPLTMDSLGLTHSIFIDEAKADTTLDLSMYIGRNPLFTSGSTGKYIGARSMYIYRDPQNVAVRTLAELQDAIKWAEDGDIISLENCRDKVGYYALGKDGFVYPDHFVDLTLKPAKHHAPELFGSLRAKVTTPLKINSFNIEGLIWKAVYTEDTEDHAPIYIVAGDSIMTALNMKNNLFQNLGKSGGGRILQAKTPTKVVVRMFIFEGNIIDNFGGNTAAGLHGQTLFQLQNISTPYEFDNIIFRNNTFHNWHGNQFITNGRNSTSNPDSTMNITFENNTLYRFGGNGTSARNFIEWTSKMTGIKAANLNINNNLFYKNWDTQHFKSGKLSLWNEDRPGVMANTKINVQNNYFYMDNVMRPEPLTTYACNLPLVGTNLTYTNYKPFTIDSLGITTNVFYDESKADTTLDLTMYKTSALYTSGLGGTCIGDPHWYTSDATPTILLGIEPITTETGLIVYSNNGMIYLKGAKSPVTIYNVMGQRLGIFTAESAERGMAVSTRGVLILSTDGETTRVMVK